MQGFFTRCKGPARYLQLQVECPKLEIRCRDIAHESRDHIFSCPARGQEISPGSFGSATVLSPEIQLPAEVEIGSVYAACGVGEILGARDVVVDSRGSSGQR